MELFYFENNVFSMKIDSLRTTRPVVNQVNITSLSNSISPLFDVIAYQKASSIIRMIYGIMGNQTFQNAMRVYLKKFAYANADSASLFDILGEHVPDDSLPVGMSLNTVAKVWLTQVGFPLVTVDYNEAEHKISVRQSGRYIINPMANDTAMSWPTPFTISVDGKRRLMWLTDDRTRETAR